MNLDDAINDGCFHLCLLAGFIGTLLFVLGVAFGKFCL
jgi:hypothetical protein